MTPNGSKRKAKATATPSQAIPSDVAAGIAKREALLATAEQSVENFNRANSSLTQIINKFIDGDEKDFKAVMAALQLWSAAKLELCGPWCELSVAMDEHEFDRSALQSALDAHVGFLHYGKIADSIMAAQMELVKMNSFFNHHPAIDDADRKNARRLVLETELEWYQIVKTFGMHDDLDLGDNPNDEGSGGSGQPA
jgi:hypothetical protein